MSVSNNILSINNYFYRRGGAEVVFLEQNRMLEESGWCVTPFAMRYEKNLDSEWSDYFIDEIDFDSQYSLLEKLVRVPKVIYSREAQHKIQALIERTTPALAHAHNIYHHISPSILPVLKRNRIPVVLTLHDLKLACPSYKMLANDGVCERCKDGNILNVIKHKCVKDSFALSTVVWLESSIHRAMGVYRDNVDVFIVPSRFYIDKMVEWGWPRERFVYIPNFVDVDALKIKGTVGRDFVFFGRLAPEKGISTFIRAAAKADVGITIVGTGPEEQSLKQLARDLNARVNFRGYLTGELLFQAIRDARAMVLPSEWYENAPMSAMESYALGTPVIGADIGGIPELIRSGETGLIFKSGDVESLAQVLIEAESLSDHEIMEMGRTARTWMEQEFTADLYRDRLLSLYTNLIKSREDL